MVSKRLLGFTATLALALACTAIAAPLPLSDAMVAQRVVDQSVKSYRGACPCPYTLATNGTHCGARSAYNRPGGLAPLCFKEDVTPGMVANFRREHPNL